jgi:hypothetical protein
MATTAPPKPPLRVRALNEFKEMAILTVYLAVTIGSVNLMKMAVLHSNGIDVDAWGAAIIKALVLAKFILIGKAFKVGEREDRGPLIWPVLRKAFAFLVLLLVLSTIEEIVKGWFHDRSVVDSLRDLFGARLAETGAGSLILLLVLIPYFAFEVLAEALGENRLVRAFFFDRRAAERG